MSNPDVVSQAVPSRWLRIVLLLLLHAATLLLVFIVLTTLAAGFLDYYRHAGIEIPAATENIIWLSECCMLFAVPIFCGMMVVDFVFMLILTSWNRSKRWPLSAFSQVFVFAALAFVVYAAIWLGNPIIWAVS